MKLPKLKYTINIAPFLLNLMSKKYRAKIHETYWNVRKFLKI